MRDDFSSAIQYIHRTTQFMLKSVIVIVCVAILFAAAQGITDAVVRIKNEQAEIAAAQHETELAEAENSIFPSDAIHLEETSVP